MFYAADAAAPDEPAPHALCSPFILTDEHLRRLLDQGARRYAPARHGPAHDPVHRELGPPAPPKPRPRCSSLRSCAPWTCSLAPSAAGAFASCPSFATKLRSAASCVTSAGPPSRRRSPKPATPPTTTPRSPPSPCAAEHPSLTPRTAPRRVRLHGSACHMGKRFVRRPGAGPERTTRPSIPPPSNSMRITVSAKGAWIGYPPRPLRRVGVAFRGRLAACGERTLRAIEGCRRQRQRGRQQRDPSGRHVRVRPLGLRLDAGGVHQAVEHGRRGLLR